MKGLRLSTRLTIAIVALVIATAGTVGYLSYRAIEAIAIPRALMRLDAQVDTLAHGLGNMIAAARADLKSFRDAVGIEEVITLSRAPPGDSIGGMTLPQWRARLARWFAAKLEAKPDYAQIMLIGLGDDGRELIRVQRSSSGTADIAPDMMRLPPDQRDAFRSAVKASPGAILVAPIELQLQDQSAPAPQAVPAIQLTAPILAADGQLLGLVAFHVDLRTTFRRVDDTTRSESTIYVVNDKGDYLIHPNPDREFGFARGTPFRIQQDFPALADAISTGRFEPEIINNHTGERSASRCRRCSSAAAGSSR